MLKNDFIYLKNIMTDKIIKIYYVIVTSISVIVLWINIALVLWTWIKQYLITDEDYIANNNYRIENCEQPKIRSDINTKNQTAEEEIKECKDKTKQELLFKRNYRFKTDIISNLTFVFAFFIIFLFHYIKFNKLQE